MTTITPKARPILFSAPMVRALLADMKTQTRRIVKPQPYLSERDHHWWWMYARYSGSSGPSETWFDHCPYGKSGDLLWVRETWGDDEQFGGKLYRATHDGDDPIGNGWRPSIHMPRSASRITLELTGVKVERLQDISDEDAKAEGCGQTIPDDVKDHPLAKHIGPSPRNHFAAVWERINGETGPGSWEANPWVWALEFRFHEVNVDEFLKQRVAA